MKDRNRQFYMIISSGVYADLNHSILFLSVNYSWCVKAMYFCVNIAVVRSLAHLYALDDSGDSRELLLKAAKCIFKFIRKFYLF